jgi:hypothetical protein
LNIGDSPGRQSLNKKKGVKMESREKAIALLSRAESNINSAREVMDNKKLFHITGELQAIDTIIYKILKAQK